MMQPVFNAMPYIIINLRWFDGIILETDGNYFCVSEIISSEGNKGKIRVPCLQGPAS